VKGHAANRENKRCDEIAEAITHLPDLPEDKGYRKEMG
jgi:ribonuclease HI